MITRTALLVGADIPLALVRSCGFEPLRGDLDDAAAVPVDVDVVVFSHLRSDHARSYHRRLAQGGAVPVVFLDLPAGGGPDVRRYTRARLRGLADRLTALTGVVFDDADLLEELRREWDAARATSSIGVGTDAVVSRAAATSREAAARAAHALAIARPWIEDDDGYGPPPAGAGRVDDDPWAEMARVHERRAATLTRASAVARAQALLAACARGGTDRIVLAGAARSDADVWFRAVLRRQAEGRVHLVEPDAPVDTPHSDQGPAGRSAGPRPRAQKQLAVAADFGEYQREWFASIRDRAAAGEPFAVVNADAPQEILRALDIPFVVNQWWASIAAAKGGAARSTDALRAAGLPTRADSYNSQGIADFLAGVDTSAGASADADAAPWGGLPVPQLLQYVRADDATAAVYEEWARLTGAELVTFDRTVESRAEFPVDWWDTMPREWEDLLERERLDLMTAQIRDSIAVIEKATGRKLDEARLRHVLDLVNEQEEWYRRTRDLIARTHPAPVGIVDTIPATMIPQWHRGTEWGRDAAKAFHHEVAARVASGAAACPDERLRVLWVGRGLWQHMWLYQAFERSHGAVFVWSMYLGLAADGYLRYMRPDQDPLRALAARFVTVGDELRMPSWAAAWHVAEARRHGVHAVVAIDDAEPFVLDELERCGIPVLRINEGNLVTDAEGIRTAIEAFLNAIAPPPE